MTCTRGFSRSAHPCTRVDAQRAGQGGAGWVEADAGAAPSGCHAHTVPCMHAVPSCLAPPLGSTTTRQRHPSRLLLPALWDVNGPGRLLMLGAPPAAAMRLLPVLLLSLRLASVMPPLVLLLLLGLLLHRQHMIQKQRDV